MNKLLLYLLIQVVAVAFSFKLRCPVSGEWRLRSKKFNCSSSQYVCLLHIRYRLDNIYMESCDGFDYSSKGSKLVFEPFFNKAQCSFKRYQPFTFSTDGSSQCVYQKSYCKEDGQFVFHKSSSQNDSTCGCNSSNGYRFVTKPKNNCYCIPSEEDCSCVKITCDNIYNHCPNDGVTIRNTTCSDTTNKQLPDTHKPSSLPNNDLIKKKHLMNKESRGRMCSIQCTYFTGVILIIMLITVPVYVLPVVTVGIKRKEIVSYGTEIDLSCNIITKVKLRSVQWFKGVEPIHYGSSETSIGKDNQIRSKLTLKEIKETDIGIYSCEVYNAIGSNKSENIQLVLALPVVTIESKRKEILKYGTKIVMSCEIKSESKLQSVQWYKGNVPVNAALSEKDSEFDNTIQSILTMNDFKESDIGVYTCEAHNEVGSSTSDSIQVVYALPVLTVKTKKIELQKYGTSIELSCQITSESTISLVQWYKNEQPIYKRTNKTYATRDITSQYLTIKDIQESDIGEYTCEVHNINGSTRTEPIQVMYALPVLTVENKKIEIKQYGERIELYCKITSEYAIQVVQWYKEEYPVCCKNNQKYETINIKSPVLVINDIQESDIGEYSCEVDNIKGRTRSESIQVVYALPVLTVETKKIEILRYGTRIELSCKTISESSITLVQWYKEEQPIHCGTNEKYSERDLKSPELVINDIQESDIGIYTCEVHNVKGCTRSEHIQVVYALPVLNVEKKKIQIQNYGTRIELACSITSEYTVSLVQWYREGLPIYCRTSEKYAKSDSRSPILTINDIQESDIGEYSCEVYNVKGCTWSEPIQVVYDCERQKFIHELVRQGECGKHYFARVVFIGKNGVGKTSLMNRLIWQKKEVATCTKSTDGIEIEKCNINVSNGKWSRSDKKDDDLIKLISQVYTVKKLNEEKTADENISDFVQVPTSNSADDSESKIDWDSARRTTKTDEKHTKVSMVATYDREEYDTETKRPIKNVQEETISKRINHEKEELLVSSDIDEHFVDTKTKEKEEKDEKKIKDNEEKDENKMKEKEEKNETKIKEKEVKDKKDENNVNEEIGKDDENEDNEETDKKIDIMTSAIMDSYFQRIEVESTEILASCWLWDFAGQKDFYATHQAFLSKCAVYLLVTDKLEASYVEKLWTDFDSAAEYVRFWFNSIHCYRPIDPVMSTTNFKIRRQLDPPVIVVCTNEDKVKDPIERKNRQEQFIKNLGDVLNEKNKAHIRNIYFVSNTEDDDVVFERIRENISSQAKLMNDWGKDCPLKWLLFQQVLGKLKETDVPISTTKALKKIARHKDIGITDDEEFVLCLQYYHDIGTIIYFDEETLRNYIILDPEWLVDAFRCLVSDKITDIISLSRDWRVLKERGELTGSLISLLFEKEPKLKFLENKEHLLEVMKRFDIVVNVANSDTLYMPCMMEACSFTAMQKKFMDENHVFNRTSWLCFQFDFLPPVFFHHVLAWCIKHEHWDVSEIVDSESATKRFALYRQIGVFNLDKSGCEQLVICEAPNVIAMQVWNSGSSENTYEQLRCTFSQLISNICCRYRLNVSFIKTFKCKDGNFVIDRKEMLELLQMEFRCNEHKCNHFSDELLKPWGCTDEKEEVIQRHVSVYNAQVAVNYE